MFYMLVTGYKTAVLGSFLSRRSDLCEERNKKGKTRTAEWIFVALFRTPRFQNIHRVLFYSN